MSPHPVPVEVRFWTRVNLSAGLDGCWLWTGPLTQKGYGARIRARGGVLKAPHRVAYELLVGPIPDGLVLDHLCRVRHCVNPRHLEPVTHRENILRGQGVAAIKAKQTHCIRGHEFTSENTYVRPDGRRCRACGIEARRHNRLKRLGVAS